MLILNVLLFKIINIKFHIPTLDFKSVLASGSYLLPLKVRAGSSLHLSNELYVPPLPFSAAFRH